MAKEVKKPRKPATKKISNKKKVEETTEVKKELVNTIKDFTNTEETSKEETIKENELNPKEIIEKFTEASQKLDNIMISENPEEKLKEELEKANEVAEKLEKQIKEQEEKYYKPNKPWNGVSDGWFDY